MSTKLDRLLNDIHPDRILTEAERCVDEAVISLRGNRSCVTDWVSFKAILVRFLRHVEMRVLCTSSYPEGFDDFQWRRCVQLLCEVYHSEEGEKTAFELARTGNEGGLYGVLKALANLLARQYASGWASTRILSFWNALSAAEKFATTSEYLSKYGDLLPSELTEGSAARLRANFPKVIEQHPQLLRELGRIGRG